jgi:sugar lactone lactonase YvrE
MKHPARAAVLVVAAFSIHGARAADPPPLPESFSVDPVLYATGFEFAEGPAFDNEGNLFVANYRVSGNIGRITHQGQASIWCELNKIAPCEGREPRASGIKVDSEGSLVVADSGAGRLLRISQDGQHADVLTERFEGLRYNVVNDVAIGRNAIFFSDPGQSNEQMPLGSVYRYENTSRVVTRVATDLAFPNGLTVSPENQFLCVSESRRFRVLIYDLAPDGTASNERVLIQFPDADRDNVRGGPFEPDGMIFDEYGRLYVCMGIGGIVNVVEVPSGKLLRQYSAGGPKATNCHFFGKSLYITVAAHEAVYRLPLGVRGHDYRPQ